MIQSCPTLSDPMDCSPLGPYTHGMFQAKVLEWVAIAFSGKKHYSVTNILMVQSSRKALSLRAKGHQTKIIPSQKKKKVFNKIIYNLSPSKESPLV